MAGLQGAKLVSYIAMFPQFHAYTIPETPLQRFVVMQESSFYLALTSPGCKGTAMVLDERVLPLTRIWCLFEVYHTIRLSEAGNFQGEVLGNSSTLGAGSL